MTQAREAKKAVEPSPDRTKHEGKETDDHVRGHPFIDLQRAAGNQAVLRLLESQSQFQTNPEHNQSSALDFSLRSASIQTKFAVSQPNDPAEREADSIAEQVVGSRAREHQVQAQSQGPELSECAFGGQGKSLAVSNPIDAAEQQPDELAQKVKEEQPAAIYGPVGTISRGENKIHRKINIAGKLDYAPGQPSAKLKGFTKLAVEALNEINQGTTGVDGPLFLQHLTNAKATYDVTMKESAEYNPDANKLSDEAGDLSRGGILKWNPYMGFILGSAAVNSANTEKSGNEAPQDEPPSTALQPDEQNLKMSPIRVLLHELDHADRSNFIKPIITNLGNSAIEDKSQGLTPEQKSYLEQRLAQYPIEAGWIRDEFTYKEVKNSIIREYNSEKGEEERVVKGSETRSGQTMKEGTRTDYETGVIGIYKAKGFKSTEEGTATNTEKKSIEEENARIKEMNKQIEDERQRVKDK
jgi:hypothetical protein